MNSATRVYELIQIAKSCSPDEFLEKLGGHVLIGDPVDGLPMASDTDADDEATNVATAVWDGTLSAGRGSDLSTQELHVLRRRGLGLLGKSILVGRSSRADVRLPQESVSKRHARFRTGSSGQMLVSDAGSSNGTYVNGAPVSPGEEVEIHHKDELRLGSRTFRFYDARRLHLILSHMVAPKDDPTRPPVD